MIRRMGEGDLEAVAAIWLDANREAHDFIPASYWLGHFEEVRTALAQAEVWVFEAEARAEISGFIGLQEDYIAGIFVRREARSGGVGRQLLDHVKARRRQLRLHVYRKNLRAGAFYPREGVYVLEGGVDPGTGEAELLMEWRRGGPQS